MPPHDKAHDRVTMSKMTIWPPPQRLHPGLFWLLGLAVLLVGCAHPVAGTAGATPQAVADLLPAPAIILGEQHDAKTHQSWQAQVVRQLGTRQQLAALVLEMAEAGHDTRGLGPLATEAEAQLALNWDGRAWPWQQYGPVVMAAVRTGVVVWGGNLPRHQLPKALDDTSIDRWLDAKTWAYHLAAIEQSHCGLLPASQISRMARVQVARDRSMAEAVGRVWRPGGTVVLVTGNEHARRSSGVPRHLDLLPPPWPVAAGPVRVVHMQTTPAAQAHHTPDTTQSTDTTWVSEPLPAQDHCASLRDRWSIPSRQP